jgi:glycosyltransferase involved in cell wall biosynthesis
MVEALNKSCAEIKLLLFTNSVQVGGMEEHVELLARHLDHDKFKVYGISPHWEPTEKFSKSLAAEVEELVEITPDRRYGLWKEVEEAYKFFRQLRKWHIQVMHMHSTTYRGQFVALAVARLAGVRRIYITEHLAPENSLPFFKKLSRNLFSRMVDGIVCVSAKNYQARLTHIYTPKEKTIVVNNGVDLDDFTPIPEQTLVELREKYQIPADGLIVGTVVRFEPEKGLNYLIDAAVEIKKTVPNAYFLMVGDGSLREDLKSQVERLGLSDCFRFTGFQSDPRPYLGLMDAFVLPVPVGSMSIGLLEAMAMQKAIVITFGGPGEAVVDGESGFWAEPRNSASIAQKVICILQDSGLRKRLGESARERVATEFSAQRVAKVLAELYVGP